MKSAKSNSRLAAALQQRMVEASQFVTPEQPELGTITGSMGLKLDSFPEEIPKTDYMVCRTLMLKDTNTENAGDPSHKHAVKMTAVIPNLSAGDRVLVIYAGNEPVVIDVVQRMG